MPTARKAPAKSTSRKGPTKPRTTEPTPNTAAGASAISAFKQASAAKQLPSGLYARINVPGMQGFIAAGVVPNTLMGAIQEALNTGQQPDMNKVIKNNEKAVADMLKMVDDVTCLVMLEPTCNPAPQPGEPRDENLLYVDEMTYEDRMFIFQFAVGGTADLDRFREEFSSSLADVPGGQDMASAPQRPRRTTTRKPRSV